MIDDTQLLNLFDEMISKYPDLEIYIDTDGNVRLIDSDYKKIDLIGKDIRDLLSKYAILK